MRSTACAKLEEQRGLGFGFGFRLGFGLGLGLGLGLELGVGLGLAGLGEVERGEERVGRHSHEPVGAEQLLVVEP